MVETPLQDNPSEVQLNTTEQTTADDNKTDLPSSLKGYSLAVKSSTLKGAHVSSKKTSKMSSLPSLVKPSVTNGTDTQQDRPLSTQNVSGVVATCLTTIMEQPQETAVADLFYTDVAQDTAPTSSDQEEQVAQADASEIVVGSKKECLSTVTSSDNHSSSKKKVRLKKTLLITRCR